MAQKRRRKPRIGEVVCRCGAYEFPHRATGGKCTCRYVVTDYWEKSYGGGTCRDCPALTEEDGMATCQVVDGQEKLTECPVFQDFIHTNEIKLKASL